MSSNPLVPPASPDPVPGPDTPSPTLPPTPGPDTPPEPGYSPGFPPISPLSPAIDTAAATASQQAAFTSGTAYPEPPPHYEQSPLTPPARTQGVDVAAPSSANPEYQPSGLGSAVPADVAAPTASHHTGHPEAPPAYEQPHSGAAVPPPPAAPGGPAFEESQDHPRSQGSTKAPALVVSAVVALALALVLGGAWYFLHAGGHVITAGGELAATAAGLHYENGHERIAFTAPGTWSRFPASTAQVMVRGEGCSFGLLEQRTLLSAQQLADAEAKDLHRRHPEAAPVIAPRLIAGHEGLAFSGSYTDSEGQPMTQTYILVDRGNNLLTLIETGTSTSCPAAFLNLEDSLRI